MVYILKRYITATLKLMNAITHPSTPGDDKVSELSGVREKDTGRKITTIHYKYDKCLASHQVKPVDFQINIETLLPSKGLHKTGLGGVVSSWVERSWDEEREGFRAGRRHIF